MTTANNKQTSGSPLPSPLIASSVEIQLQGTTNCAPDATKMITSRKRKRNGHFPMKVNNTWDDSSPYPLFIVEDNDSSSRRVRKCVRCSIEPVQPEVTAVNPGGRYEAPLKSPHLESLWSHHVIREPPDNDVVLANKRRPVVIRAVHFAETVCIQDIPPASIYTQEERVKLWTSLAELKRNAERNAAELNFDGDWRDAAEEEKFCVWEDKDGESTLIHPYTYEVYTSQKREAEMHGIRKGSISKVSSFRDLSQMSKLVC